MGIVLKLPCSKNIWNSIKQKKPKLLELLIRSQDFSFPCKINIHPNTPLFSFFYPFRSLGRRRYWKLSFHAFGAIQHQSCWYQFYHCLVVALQFFSTIRNVLALYAVTDWLKKLLKGALPGRCLCPACPKDQTETNCFACRSLPGLIAKTHSKIHEIRRSASYCSVMLTVLTKKVVCRAFNLHSLVFSLLGFFPPPSSHNDRHFY